MSDAYSENAAMAREADAERPALGKEWYERQIDANEEFEVGAGGVRQADYQAKLRRIAETTGGPIDGREKWATLDQLRLYNAFMQRREPGKTFTEAATEARMWFIDAVLKGEI